MNFINTDNISISTISTILFIIFAIFVIIFTILSKNEKHKLNVIQSVLSNTNTLCGATEADKIANAGKLFTTPITCVDKFTLQIVNDSFCTTLASSGKISTQPVQLTYTCPRLFCNTIIFTKGTVGDARSGALYSPFPTTNSNSAMKVNPTTGGPKLLINTLAFPGFTPIVNSSYTLDVNTTSYNLVYKKISTKNY